MSRDFSRTSRVNAELHRELAQLIRDDLRDPRVAGVTVTRVEASSDFTHAKVWINTYGDEAELKEAVAVLRKAAGRLRHGLGPRLLLRVIPNLSFQADLQLREAERLDGLIKTAVSRDEEIRHARGDAAADEGDKPA